MLSEADATYETRSELFEVLRSVGIVFLNASYTQVGGTIMRSKHQPFLVDAHCINVPFLRAAKSVIYCGEAWKISWIDQTLRVERSVHPDVRNKHNPRTEQRWKQSWGANVLFNRLGLVLPSREQATASR